LAGAVSLGAVHKQKRQSPEDGFMVRLAQRPQLQHYSTPAGRTHLRPRMGQRNLFLLHAPTLRQNLQNHPLRRWHSPPQLAPGR